MNPATSNDTAIVEARVKYTMTSGRQISQSLRYFFVWDAVSERRLIEKVQKI
ncbi:hypothetical protein DSM106972_029350 [Dulcicalothrix desertica PCC 7102]|uniref:Uncharacterized protein n=1 Tax=Dulcicalothrix desertica PCC 7102 TaxID=232991 RepID=A0A433VKM0_9CYAN|nr:hypothetical protein [Dulcicalothrix desertica]RUT06678.1 hypothetical protein DSM106972_029350 [Dulcicalothrix desertica PCC 7102]